MSEANHNSFELEEDISISKLISNYLQYWKWFVLSVLLSLILAFVYLRYAKPQYNTITTILINDPSEGRGLSELAAFSDLSAFSDVSNDIDDEVDILKSKTLLSRVISDLGVNVSQYAKGKIKSSSLYKKSPVNISFNWNVNKLDVEELESKNFELLITSNSDFILKDLKSDTEYKSKFGKTMTFDNGDSILISLEKSFDFHKYKNNDRFDIIEIQAEPIYQYALRLQKLITVTPKSKRSSIIDLSMVSTDKLKAKDILNRLVYQYNKQSIDDKNIISNNTSKFIDKRLSIISEELDKVEFDKANFKIDNDLTNLIVESEVVISKEGNLSQKILDLDTQLELTNSMIGYLSNDNRDSDLMPANIGINNVAIVNQINQYNTVVIERDRLLNGSTKLNPLVVNLESNIKTQKNNLIESLKNQLSSLRITKKDLSREFSKLDSRISKMPKQEKNFRAIERKQTIKETLYLFLLEKREETSISMAVTAPVAKVIDIAYSSTHPIAPKKKIIMLASLILGLIIPFSVIYIKDLLDTKVNEKEDVEGVLKDTPILVEAPKIKKGESDMLSINDRTVLGESFRILRTNLNYFAKSKKRENKELRVFVTSTVKGEGKTFVSFNTILSLADASK